MSRVDYYVWASTGTEVMGFDSRSYVLRSSPPVIYEHTEYSHIKYIGLKVLAYMFRLVVRELGGNPVNVTFWQDKIKIEVTCLCKTFCEF